jgi:hypothetical protein
MQPQYLDQYGSWYRIVDGDLECTPAWFDGSIDIDEWSTVEEPAPNTGEWEEAIEFLNTINERFKSQFTPRQFGLSRNHYLQKGYTPAPKILHIWDNDNLVISTLHGFLEANAESLTPDEMKAINLLDMEDFRVSIIGNHCGWVTIERVQ